MKNITQVIVLIGLSVPFLWLIADIIIKFLNLPGLPTITTVIRTFEDSNPALARNLYFLYGLIIGWMISHFGETF